MKVVLSTIRTPVPGTLNTSEVCKVEIFNDAGVLVATGSHQPWPRNPDMKFAAKFALTVLDEMRQEAAMQIDAVLDTKYAEKKP